MRGCSRRNFAGGLPETSNSYCHPGIAGCLPLTLDSNALAQLGTPAARRKRKSEHPIWISIGPQNSGVKLGYRAAEAGAWLAALTFEGERLEAVLGPADDENAPPEALNIWDAASAAVAWAESERARIDVGSRAAATPGTAADLTAELNAARAARAIAEARAAQFETERDSAAAASESLRTLAARLIGERAYLAGLKR